MATPTFTATGTKATTAAKLSKEVFGVEVANHQLLKQAYETYLANGRENYAVVKTRGLVSGGGRKPWKQKGTGRARFGSTRNPIWRGGGIVFGPTGEENYTKKISTTSKRVALRQALSLANEAGKIIVIETFECKEGKVSKTADLLKKLGAERNTLIVVSMKDDLVERATRNLPNAKAVSANYLNVFDILNAHHIVMSKKALAVVEEWLKPVAKTKEAK
ncbi:MAG: 50S ribosomal protein L4 [Candidatus Saccharimonadales bacterium]